MTEFAAVERFTANGKAAFLADDRDQYAVMLAYARIGEIVKRIPNEMLATQPQIEWNNIKGFRDVLLHRYFDVSMERVWEAVEKLPDLRAAVETLLASLPPETPQVET
ncbi:MAG: DUF86 domain-containing protein [Anaerolineae bacterium]|nr:DUF86 domain-containing protein [Anaerolineae bacterium]